MATVKDEIPRTVMTVKQQRRIGALQVAAQLSRGTGYRGLTSQEVSDAMRMARFIAGED
jgi:hypothetical protein